MNTQNSTGSIPRGLFLGWTLVLGGWVVASVLGNGDELSRLALVLPLLTLGVGLQSLSCRACFGGLRWTYVSVFGVIVYFLVRAWFSPVYDLGRRDLFLVGVASLSLFAGFSSLSYPRGRTFLLGVLLLVFVGHAWISIVQWRGNAQYAFFRPDRVDVEGVSGFYYHRNYLAGFLEMAAPIFLAVSISRRNVRQGVFWGGCFVAAFLLCFLTNSRGGFCAMLLAVFVSLLLNQRSLSWIRSRKVGRVQIGVMLGVGLLLPLGGWFLLNGIFESRGTTAGGLDDRFMMAGIALDAWGMSPWFGNGSLSYSYLFPRLFSGISGWYGNAEMAHSDYLQVLCDYGVVGFGGVVFLIAVFSYYAFRGACLSDTRNGGGWISSAACGILVGEVVRSLFDFNLHIAPNLMLFAFVLGGALSSLKNGPNRTVKVIEFSAVAGISALLLWTGRQEIHGGPLFIQSASLRGEPSTSDEVLIGLREYSEVAPSFEILRPIAQLSLQGALAGRSSLDVATLDWKRVVERHPFDGESLANYARCLDEEKRYEEAETFHLRALEAVSKRENQYGVIFGVGWHLVRQAEDAFKARRPEEALFLLREARFAFKESEQRNYGRRGVNRDAQALVDKQITFLEGARVSPIAVPILDWRVEID